MRAYLATFDSTHAALAFEKFADSAGALVAVPPTLRAGCGMGWRFVASADEEALGQARRVAQSAGLADGDWQLNAQTDDGRWRQVEWRQVERPC